MREPTLIWWPGMIPAGTVYREIGTTLDLFATIAGLTGAQLPTTPMDSHDLTGALRHGQWKAHFITQASYAEGRKKQVHEVPQLYHLGEDPGEQYNVAAQFPDILETMLQLKEQQGAAVVPGPKHLLGTAKKKGRGVTPALVKYSLADWFRR